MCSSAQHYLVSCRTLSLLLPPSLEKKLHFLVIQKQKGDYCRDILARAQDVNTSNHVKEV